MSVKIYIGGIGVDKINKAEAIEIIKEFLKDGRKHFIVTPYSEIVLFAMNNSSYREVLNKADLSLPDGIGILWAAKFLTLPSSNFFQILIQYVYTGASIVVNPKYIRTVIPEQITGSRLVFDLIDIAIKNNYSIALVGGSDNIAAQAAYELKKTYPNLKINLALSGRPFDNQTIKEIADSNSDILLIAYSPPKQEKWISENLPNLNVKLAIGLGGTLDYLAKKHRPVPDFLHYMGLEWLWRLVTQPWRALRIWNGIIVFSFMILEYKLHGKKS